jgi:putative glutamine amidotransferase
MKAARIGITTHRSQNQAGYPIQALAEHYIQAISNAGGIPLMIPLGLPKSQLTLLATQLDGILFSGGGDINPAYFGMETSEKVKHIDSDRDEVEIALVQFAAANHLPFLGICRGLQVINVALGGTLYTHIADQHPLAIKHDYYPDWARDHLPHDVRLEPGCRLAIILNTTSPDVNSLHHQGIRDLAPNLLPTGWAPDELVESIELPDHPFGLAVQWHPEWLTSQGSMRALFRSFVQAAAGEIES